MKSSSRLFWMKLHAYLACFFLPFTLIYIATGVLHLFDIHGGFKNEYEYQIQLQNGWIEDQASASEIIEPFLIEKGFPLPELYYTEPELHDWYDRKYEVIFSPTSKQTAKLIIKEHDLWMQLLFIHKGIAGNLFWIIGLFFGLHLLISILSGVILSLQLPGLKVTSIFSLSTGIFILVVLLIL